MPPLLVSRNAIETAPTPRAYAGNQRRPVRHRPAADLRDAGPFQQLHGQSPLMLELYQQIQRVAPTDATVLLTGETGTGKEVVARALHDLSLRRHGPFVALNCGAISASLIESELFGHEQGSFTGANRRHNGVFAQADGGSLLLDEITEMPLDLQVSLLRVLETGSFQRIGGEKQVPSNVRIIAAANRNPEQAVRDGKLRADLFYRLRVIPMALPPLRARGADVVLLALHFLDVLNRQAATYKRFTTAALNRLRAHAWPGNVRELRHFVQHAYILGDRELDASQLTCFRSPSHSEDQIEVRIGGTIAAAEQRLILATMERYAGDKRLVAKLLGISIKTLYARLKVYHAGCSA